MVALIKHSEKAQDRAPFRSKYGWSLHFDCVMVFTLSFRYQRSLFWSSSDFFSSCSIAMRFGAIVQCWLQLLGRYKNRSWSECVLLTSVTVVELFMVSEDSWCYHKTFLMAACITIIDSTKCCTMERVDRINNHDRILRKDDLVWLSPRASPEKG